MLAYRQMRKRQPVRTGDLIRSLAAGAWASVELLRPFHEERFHVGYERVDVAEPLHAGEQVR